MPPVPPPQQPDPSSDGVTFATFSGLKNTVSPEQLTARQLQRAQNVDLDDLGEAHRRRGRTLLQPGRWSSLFTSAGGVTFGVRDGVLGSLTDNGRDFTPLLAGIADLPLAWTEVGPTAYFSSPINSGQIDVASLTVSAWGRVVDPSYQPGLAPGPADFWFSPVVRPDDDPTSALGPVAGKLLGAPPLASCLANYNGRIYLSQGSILWATELFLYNYVDKTRGYRQFETEITGLVSVDDGVYVGTRDALYFLSGAFAEHKLSMREPSGVVPGSMLNVPANMVDPEGRRFPDLPRPTGRAMACLTNGGVVIGLGGGSTFNVTRTDFLFPSAARAPLLFRQEDGINSLVIPIQPGGPANESARFGDYCSAEVIRATVP